MLPRLVYPELTPPRGFRLSIRSSQRWLLPAEEEGVVSAVPTAIIVSPLLPTHLKLPPPAQLIPMAIRAEELATLQVSERHGPVACETEDGLSGVYFAIAGFARPSGPKERRLYVLFADRNFYYGINYVAAAERFARHEATFWQVARSIRRRRQPLPLVEPGLDPGGPAKPGEAPGPAGKQAEANANANAEHAGESAQPAAGLPTTQSKPTDPWQVFEE